MHVSICLIKIFKLSEIHRTEHDHAQFLTAFVYQILAAFEIRQSLLVPIITYREPGISANNTPDALMPGPTHDSDVTPVIEIRVPPQPLAHEDFSDHHTSYCQNAGDCMKDEQCSEDPYMFDEFSPSPEAKHDAYMPGRYMPSSGASEDPYTILGIVTDVTEKQLKRAYREMCLKHHPDKKGGATKDFQRVATAYSTLLKKFECFIISSDEEDVLKPCDAASWINKSIASTLCTHQNKLKQSLPVEHPPGTLSSPDELHRPASVSSIPKHIEKLQEPVSEQRNGRTARRNGKNLDSIRILPRKNKTNPMKSLKKKLPSHCCGKGVTSSTAQFQPSAAANTKSRSNDGKAAIDSILRPRPPSYAPPLKLRVAMMRAKHAAPQGAASALQNIEPQPRAVAYVGRFNDVEDHRRAAAAIQRAAGDSHRLWLDKKYAKRDTRRFKNSRQWTKETNGRNEKAK